MQDDNAPITVLEKKGQDLPADWRKQAGILPNEQYIVTIQSKRQHRTVKELMDEMSDDAQARGMTPEVLSEILGEDVSRIL